MVDALVLLLASERHHRISFPLPPYDFKRIPSSHLVILTVFDFQSVSMASLPYGKQKTYQNIRLTLEPSFPEEALTKLRKVWLSHQNNFHQTQIPIDKQNKLLTCHYFQTSKATFSKDVCNLKLLESKLNFTLAVSSSNGFYAKHIMVSPKNVKSTKNNGLQWLSHGLQIKSYGFLVVMDKSQIKFRDNPLAPFDIPTWILTYVSVCSVAFMFLIHQENGTENLLRTWIAYKFCILLLLIDQPSPIRPTGSGRLKPFIQLLLWAVWALACLLISQIYRGDIFSNLATKQEPHVPETFDGVMDAFPGIPIVTLEICRKGKAIFMPCVLTMLSGNMKGYSKPGTMPRKYKVLMKSLRWIPFEEKEKWGKMKHLLTERKPVSGITWNKSRTLLELHAQTRFVLVEPFQELQVFSQIMANTQYWASKIARVPLFDRWNLWMIRGKYFQLVLGTYLKQLHEAGFGTRLEGQERQFKLRQGLKIALEIIKNETSGLETTLGQYGNCQDGCSKKKNV